MERVITIVGGGLAGLSLGVALRERMPVTLHEAGTYPRHRVCGEFISGVSAHTLKQLGVADVLADAQLQRTTSWFREGREIFSGELPTPALGISRFALDERLSRKFRERGGILHEQSRQKPPMTEGTVWCAGRVAVKGSWLGLKCHVKNLSLSADLEMHLARNGYVGLARIENEMVNLCGLFRLQSGQAGRGVETLRQYLRAGGLDALWERIQPGIDEDSFLGVAGFRLGSRPASDGLVALGDAGGMIPPFTGNGMSMAFESAEIALEPLEQWHRGKRTWEETAQVIQEKLKARFRTRMWAARLMHPFLTRREGQGFLAAVSQSGLLPFDLCFRVLRHG